MDNDCVKRNLDRVKRNADIDSIIIKNIKNNKKLAEYKKTINSKNNLQYANEIQLLQNEINKHNKIFKLYEKIMKNHNFDCPFNFTLEEPLNNLSDEEIKKMTEICGADNIILNIDKSRNCAEVNINFYANNKFQFIMLFINLPNT